VTLSPEVIRSPAVLVAELKDSSYYQRFLVEEDRLHFQPRAERRAANRLIPTIAQSSSSDLG
jgi:hypothetical protein